MATTIRQRARSVFRLLRDTYENWRADRAIRLGAALAYYAVFAAVPLLTSAVAIAGIVFSEAEIQAFLVESLEAILTDVPDDIRAVVDNVAGTVKLLAVEDYRPVVFDPRWPEAVSEPARRLVGDARRRLRGGRRKPTAATAD